MVAISAPGANRPDLSSTLRKSATAALARELEEPLQLLIIEKLLDGPRSIAELVEQIYGSTNGQPGYMTSYTKTRRALEKLSSKGYVSRRHFGAVKPYRLTDFAITRLASFSTGKEPPRLLPTTDRITHLATLCLALFLLLSVSGRIQLSGLHHTVLNAAFFFTLGLSASRIIQGLRRVF